MTYLYQQRKKSKKHIWDSNNNDTYCTMWSTGGLKKNKDWLLSEREPGKETCTMCINNYKRRKRHSKTLKA